jgi:endonuclease/exonuclease/phosphatase family metal-dependent hydrolase
MARRRRRSSGQRVARDLGRLLGRRRGPLLPLLLLIIALLGGGGWWLQQVPLPPVAPSAVGADVRIATWNLRKFSDRDNLDLVTIAKLIKENQFDLVALQEVQQQGQAAQRLRRQLNEPWRIEVSGHAGDGERFAYLYRLDRMELIGRPHLLPGPEGAIFARRPYIATFRAGEFDFILITVHFSWGNVARRQAETEALARYVERLAAQGAEKDIIVLGDFNEQKRQRNLHYFEARGWRPLNDQPTNLGSTEVYDNLLINHLYTREWTRRVGVVRFDETVFGNDDKRASSDVSDHRPVWADFSTAGPDDD